MLELLKEQMLPAFIGIAATFASWLFVKFFFSPRLKISDKISKKEVNGRAAYRVKIKNCGYRMCSDIIIYAKLEVKGLEPNLKNNFDSFFIDVSFGGIYPALKRGRSILLHIYKTTEYDKSYYSPAFNDAIENASSIEELLELTDDSKLTVYVIATDNYSGVRKLYVSGEYRHKSIEPKNFCIDSVKIKSE